MYSEPHNDVVLAAVACIVGQSGAQTGCATLARVGPALTVKRYGAEVFVARGEQLLVEHIAHLCGVGRWVGRDWG